MACSSLVIPVIATSLSILPESLGLPKSMKLQNIDWKVKATQKLEKQFMFENRCLGCKFQVYNSEKSKNESAYTST